MKQANSSSTRIAKNTLMLYIRMMFVMGVNLFSVRFVLDLLGEVDYGLYNVVAGMVTMFSFLSGTMASATQRYISYEIPNNNEKKLKEIFNLSFLSYISIAILVVLIAETLGLWFLNNKMVIPHERLNAIRWVYQASIFSFAVTILGTTFLSQILAHEKMNIFAIGSIVDNVLRLIIIFIIPLIKSDNLILYSCSLALITVGVQLTYLIYTYTRFKECRFTITKNWILLKEMTAFASWNMIGALANVFKLQGVNILLNIFFNPVVNAARAVAFQVNNAINQMTINFYMAMRPQIVKTYASNEHNQFNELVLKGAKLGFYLMMLLSIPLLVETEYILSFWLKEIPPYTVIFCRLMIIDSLIDVFSFPLVNAIQATGKIKRFQIVVSSIILLNLPVSYFLYKQGSQPETAMVVSIVLATICFIPRIYFAYKQANISYRDFFNNVLLKTIPLFAIVTITTIFFTQLKEPSFYRLLITTISSMSISILLIYNLGLSKKEKIFVISLIREIIKLEKNRK